jgi:hypothetical protein
MSTLHVLKTKQLLMAVYRIYIQVHVPVHVCNLWRFDVSIARGEVQWASAM